MEAEGTSVEGVPVQTGKEKTLLDKRNRLLYLLSKKEREADEIRRMIVKIDKQIR